MEKKDFGNFVQYLLDEEPGNKVLGAEMLMSKDLSQKGLDKLFVGKDMGDALDCIAKGCYFTALELIRHYHNWLRNQDH